jgi:dsRNA-specific ribonuclease
MFTVEVIINGQVVGTGHGLNKRAGEMEAARQALLSLERIK